MRTKAGWHAPSRPGWAAVTTLAVVVGLMIRLNLGGSPLWLDEAQNAALTRLPLGEIGSALEHDGHPPLFYWLLHGWTEVFGHSDRALRALPALFGLGALVALWFAGRRLGGSAVAWTAVALGALSPFLVRYATEVRMYSLVTLLALVWWLVACRAREEGALRWLVALALLTGLLVLTHYWSFFFLAAWGAAELVRWWRAGRSAVLLRPLLAVAVGSLVFLVWIGSFLAQLQHTGTPWAEAPNPAAVLTTTLFDLNGGWLEGESQALTVVMALLLVIGFAGRRAEGTTVELDLRGRPGVYEVTWLALGPLLIGAVAITVLDSAFASRYAAVVVGFLILIAARGIVTLGPAMGLVALVMTSALGAVGAWRATDDVRSQGREVALAVNAEHDGSGTTVVVACPDQLGPAVARYAEPGVEVLGYPTLQPADWVDWVDYAERNGRADPATVADDLVALADGDIWLVWREGYVTYGSQCEQLRAELEERGVTHGTAVSADTEVFEAMWLSHVVLR